jgi:uncharacterized protein (DUF934 family)
MHDDLAPPATAARHLIRYGKLEADDTRLFDADQAGAPFPPDEPGWVVPLPVWLKAGPEALRRAHPLAVQLPPDAELRHLFQHTLAGDAPAPIAYLAIEFPSYTDGRGYSLAQLLRHEYGWKGELRAVGDVMIDTIHYLARCGFDSFLVKPGHDPRQALAALTAFTVHYQRSYPSIPGPAPLSSD